MELSLWFSSLKTSLITQVLLMMTRLMPAEVLITPKPQIIAWADTTRYAQYVPIIRERCYLAGASDKDKHSLQL